MIALDLSRIDLAELQHDPFEYIVIQSFIDPESLDAINRDFPPIDSPRNIALEELEYGGAFGSLVDAVKSPEFEKKISSKFGVNIVGKPLDVSVRRFSEITEGDIHTDAVRKVITVLIYFNKTWPHKEGRLRLLRSATDMEDYSEEIAPEKGNLVAFKRNDWSFHGLRPFEGERRAIQFSWIAPKKVSTLKKIKRLLGLKKS
jgi:SM-20-related protein